MLSIRLLEPGDEGVLAILAADAADFGLSDSGEPLPALTDRQSARYLSDSSVVHWAAFDGGEVVGSLVTIALPLPVSPGAELLLYEIGVRRSRRRRGVGTALVRRMDAWMVARDISTVWVLADGEDARTFYASCGFVSEHPAPAYMVRSVRARD